MLRLIGLLTVIYMGWVTGFFQAVLLYTARLLTKLAFYLYGLNMNDTIDNLYEELVYLCEVRGELDPESNAQIEARIAAINAEIKELKSLSSRWG